jgi:hypothetical protein
MGAYGSGAYGAGSYGFGAAGGTVSAKPSVLDVALLLRTRTVKGSMAGLGADSGPADFTTFDSGTRPSAAEVSQLIDTAYDAMYGRLTLALTSSHFEAFSHVVAMYTAILVEVSFFRESANRELLELWRETIDDMLAGINMALERDQGGTVSGFSVGSIPIGTVREPKVGVPPAYWMEGIDC